MANHESRNHPQEIGTTPFGNGQQRLLGQSKAMTLEFLAVLDPTTDRFTFQTFDDNKERGDKRLARIFHGTLDECFPELVRLNNLGAGIFVTVNATDLQGRSNKNIVRVRALFVDADDNDQKLHCVGVIEACGVRPSMIVITGRGLHIYFICSDIPLEQFDALLRSLIGKLGTDTRCVGLTRVLRLPGFLHQKDKPRPVRLYPTKGAISTWTLAELVETFGLNASSFSRRPARATPKSAAPIEVAPALRHLDPQQKIGANIVIHELPPLPLESIKAECAWLREAHATGGKDYDQPQWNLTTLCGVFLENGHELAHQLGNKHPDYVFEKTEELWERKNDERKRGVGWPSCEEIKIAGSKHCESCKHFAAKPQSPLHLGLQGPQVPAGEFNPSDEYEPVNRDAGEINNTFVKLDAVWVTRIFDGDTDGTYQNDPSQLAFAVACELVRWNLNIKFIERVLMTTKCGEYVQERPAYRLWRTIRRAYEFKIDPDLERMNSQHAVLPIGGKTRVVTWCDDPDFPGRKMIVRAQTFDDFKNLHSNKKKKIEIIDKDKKPETVYTPIGHWWLGQEHRRQYDGGQRFMPQYETEFVGDVLNMFEGFPIQPRKPEGRSAASACPLILDHGFKIMCSGNEEHWDYLLKREAWIAQNRRRSEIAAGYRTDEEGSGKGCWCNHLGRLYGPHFMQVKRPEHVIGEFNKHLEVLIKLCADEAMFVGDPRHRNVLFGLITEPTIGIIPKFIDLVRSLTGGLLAGRILRRRHRPIAPAEHAGRAAFREGRGVARCNVLLRRRPCHRDLTLRAGCHGAASWARP
jgi:hypothetical protein